MSVVAVVTGGTRGIGLEICKRLALSGASVAILGRSACARHPADLAVVGPSQKHLALACDVTDPASLGDAAQQVADQLGPVRYLTTSAGIVREGLLLRMRPSTVQEILETNVAGTINACRAFLPPMIRQRHGSIVLIGSVMGHRGQAGLCAYSASKGALTGLCASLARELGGRNVRVNVVAPGFIRTDMTSSLDDAAQKAIVEQTMVKRLGTAEDVAGAVRFLLSDEAAYITGQTILVDGGLSA
jgi:3-oxoacyl-[acyl-carrier protein] reductase